MKKLLLFSANVLLATFTAISGSITEGTAPTYLAPEAEQKFAMAKSIIAKSKAMKNQAPKPDKTAAVKLAKVKYARINGTALDASAKEIITIDTLLVTSYDNISDGEPYNYANVKYDKYGRRTLLVERGDSTRYTYTVDNNTRWLSRIVEERNDGRWEIRSKEERTIENDKVKTFTLYTIEDDRNSDQKVPIKTSYFELEYGHAESLDLYSRNIKDAAITHHIEYELNGDVSYEERFTWVDKFNDYVRTYYWEKGRRSEAKIFDDHITTTDYTKPYSYETDTFGDEYKQSEFSVFFGDKKGNVDIYFNEDGSIQSSNCSVYDGYKEANGDSTVIYYNYIDSNFVPKSKYTMSYDYYHEIDYTRDFNQYYMSYDYVDGKWVETSSYYKIEHRLLPNGLSEIKSDVGGWTTSNIVKVEKTENEEGYIRWESYPAIVNDDNSYTVVKSLSGEEYMYCYYLADGTLQKTIWQKESGISDGKIFLVKTGDGTEWTTLDEYSTTAESGDVKVRVVYKTNAEGKPASMTEYTTHPDYNGGKEFKSLETLYTYKTNGDFTVETYETYTPKDISKLAISEKTERVTLDDGTIQLTEWEYDDNGKGQIDSATRTETKDFLTKFFDYKKKSDSWELRNAIVEDEIYTTEDGIDVYITRELSEDQMTAIKNRKTEHKEIYGENGQTTYYMDASYSWDAENNKWIGDNKNESYYYNYTFECIPYYKFDPIEAYSDEYMVIIPDDSDNYEHNVPISHYYIWDNSNDEWKDYSNREEFMYSIDGDTLTETKKETGEDWDGKKVNTETTKTTRDSHLRMIQTESVSEEYIYKNDGENEHRYQHRIIYYTYNAKTGLLEEIKEVSLDKDGKEEYSNISRYTYSNFSIETSDIETITTKGDDILIINGRNISAPGKAISVYNLNGISISSTIDSAELPSLPGIYIVKAGNITRKVAVK